MTLLTIVVLMLVPRLYFYQRKTYWALIWRCRENICKIIPYFYREIPEVLMILTLCSFIVIVTVPTYVFPNMEDVHGFALGVSKQVFQMIWILWFCVFFIGQRPLNVYESETAEQDSRTVFFCIGFYFLWFTLMLVHTIICHYILFSLFMWSYFIDWTRFLNLILLDNAKLWKKYFWNILHWHHQRKWVTLHFMPRLGTIRFFFNELIWRVHSVSLIFYVYLFLVAPFLWFWLFGSLVMLTILLYSSLVIRVTLPFLLWKRESLHGNWSSVFLEWGREERLSSVCSSSSAFRSK